MFANFVVDSLLCVSIILDVQLMKSITDRYGV